MAFYKCIGNRFKAYVNVYGQANGTATLTSGSTVFSGTLDSNGYAQLVVKKKGNYTVATSGTTHTTTVNITTTHQTYNPTYSWTKYNSVPTYSYSTGTISGYQNFTIGQPYWHMAMAGRDYSSSFEFSSSTGKFKVIYQTLIDYSYFEQWSTGGWINGAGCFVLDKTNRSGDKNSPYGDTQYDGCGYSTKNSATNIRFNFGSGYTMRDAYISYYSRGGTNYGTVTNVRPSAYPMNNRYSADGYWYVAS